MKKGLLFVALLLITTNMFAQKANIVFTESTFDFGTVSEEDGKVSHVFEFTNTGTADLVLTNVQASCGCTTPQWVREPVAPKQKGTITVTYAAAGRPGPFTKTITVTSNADKQVLIIKGTVTPRGQKVEEIYPVLDGDVRIASENVNFGDIAAGETKIQKLSIVNVSKKDVLVTLVNLPSYITAETKQLKADEKGNISITLNGSKLKEWGSIKQEVNFVTGNIKDKKAPKYKLVVTGNVFEKFTEQQIANAPVIQVSNEVTAGDVVKGKKKSVVVTLKNTGKSPLIVRTATSDDASVIVTPSKPIDPGKEGKLKVTIDATKLTAQAYKRNISLMLNEPNNVHKTFVLSFNVK